MADSVIHVRGVRTHNLQNIDLDLPCGKLIGVCGVSGSGKSSLAVDTLCAEGQRRYAETFSTFARQFLERLERPDVDQIDGLPPPIRIQEAGRAASRRATVGTATGIHDLLSVLFAEAGKVVCPACRRTVGRNRVEDVAALMDTLPDGLRLLIAFPIESSVNSRGVDWREHFRMLAFRRVIAGDRLLDIESREAAESIAASETEFGEVVIDRLSVGTSDRSRLVESLETARDHGSGRYVVYLEASEAAEATFAPCVQQTMSLDGRDMLRCPLSDDFMCDGCGRQFIEPTPLLFSFYSPVGACTECEGLSSVELESRDRASRRTKGRQTCPACAGQRLRPEALAVQVGGKSIAAVATLPATQLVEMIRELGEIGPHHETPRPVKPQLLALVQTLIDLGIGYLPLARPLRSLSRGERQRVAFAAALSSSLAGAMYVLDEPTVGLHAADMERVVRAIQRLRDRGNTVVVVEHEAAMLRAADMLIELGPCAGQEGGRVLFAGTPAELYKSNATGTPTGGWLAGLRGQTDVSRRRPLVHGHLRLIGAKSKNLKGVSVKVPLGVLCVVTGVSGAGKTALVEQALYPAIAERLTGIAATRPAWDDIQGIGQIERVELVTHVPPPRSARSNPVTYVKAFDTIRRLYAETVDATTRNHAAGFFSFNVAGGRCERCKGEGRLTVDMQFLPDLAMVCPECYGRRYGAEALTVLYRGRSIADVLQMTVREAMSFFRGQRAVQSRLACLKEVGLDYLGLGQPLSTLSGGEAQRLKLASLLQAKRAGRTLYIFDEPTAGLHATDICKLLDCFDALLAVGHSVVAATHSLLLFRAADHVIELGPCAGEDGGRVVATGTPEQIAANPDSVTGQYVMALSASS